MVSTNKFIYIYVIALASLYSCTEVSKRNYHNYPSFVRENHFEKIYDDTKWIYFSQLGEKKTFVHDSLNTIIIKDTVCIAFEPSFGSIIRDSLLELSFFSNRITLEKKTAYCKCFFSKCANNFIYHAKSSKLKALSEDGVVPINLSEANKWYNIQEKLDSFPNVIRKYKNQLNPWLKAEAQRRGIID